MQSELTGELLCIFVCVFSSLVEVFGTFQVYKNDPLDSLVRSTQCLSNLLGTVMSCHENYVLTSLALRSCQVSH